MREIKFRAWDKELERICEVIKINFLMKTIIVFHPDEEEVSSYLPLTRFELMQYTGLKDKNGKEGYHKDLWLFHGVIYIIEWDAEEAMFYLKYPDERATLDDHISMCQLNLGEIIGNICENPELLTV